MRHEPYKDKSRTAFGAEALGLALSGGGFRASLFHIGVLARMAELDILRDVQAISTVSGGSIVGAQYYLYLKRLLEEKPDAEITRRDYLAVVENVQNHFLSGVRQNIRMRTFLSPSKNFRMRKKNYSRSDRIGELYDEYFYKGILPGQGQGMIQMRDLRINPPDHTGATPFHPMRDNGARKAKAPVLLINATTFNDGHSWLFEASTMGEPPLPDLAAYRADKNFRLCRPDSYENTKEQKDVELGLAVAASACVPGVFPPLALSGLYAQGVRAELADGGVYDNQGVQALLDRKCTRLIVSDASGQMSDEIDPSPSIFAMIPRMNDVLMDRVREQQLLPLLRGQGPGTDLLHLRQDLDVEYVPWIDAQGRDRCDLEPLAAPETAPGPAPAAPAEIQDRLSRLRTDLDCFNDVEAYSLMLDAYRIAGNLLAPAKGPHEEPDDTGDKPGDWVFLDIAKEFDRKGGPDERFLRILDTGQKTLLKAFALDPRLRTLSLWLKRAALILILLLAALALWLLWRRWFLGIEYCVQADLRLCAHSLVPLLLAALAFFLPDLARVMRIAEFLLKPSLLFRRWVLHAGIALIGALAAWIQIRLLDPLFLKAGRYPQEF